MERTGIEPATPCLQSRIGSLGRASGRQISPVRDPPTAGERRRPHKLHADKGYDYRHLRLALRKHRIIPRIARCGVEPKNRLGRYRWVVERTLSWLNRFRRLKIRYEHRADIHLAFLQLGCALISLRFLG